MEGAFSALRVMRAVAVVAWILVGCIAPAPLVAPAATRAHAPTAASPIEPVALAAATRPPTSEPAATRPPTADRRAAVPSPQAAAYAGASAALPYRSADSGPSLLADSLRAIEVTDFDAVHARTDGDPNRYLIFGNLNATPPAPGLAPDLAAFLGRWEGYDLNPRAPKDLKTVLFVRQITQTGGTALIWSGTTIQYPLYLNEIAFRVVPGRLPAIAWESDIYADPYAPQLGKVRITTTLSHLPKEDALRGDARAKDGASVPILLDRSRSYYVYKDYATYFAEHGIEAKEYRDPSLMTTGQGYMVYLPAGYQAEPSKDWPLILFLIGTGERGTVPYLLAKHGPLKIALEGQALPFIIVAPMLNVSPGYRSFPDIYLDGVLKEILTDYRVDQSRIYLTGISMGGEAADRYAVHRPQTFAAMAPIAGFNARYIPSAQAEGFRPFDMPTGRLQGMPVWALQGANDPIVPLAAARRTAADLRAAGADVTFTVLPDHGHDAWTDTYSDPAFYAWLLQHARP